MRTAAYSGSRAANTLLTTTLSATTATRSDEVYIWLQGDFTYITEDGATVDLSHHSYM